MVHDKTTIPHNFIRYIYVDSGNLLYKGSFINGKYYGRGILYDASSGRVLEAGEFRNGVLTIPERMEEIDDENAYIERQESIP